MRSRQERKYEHAQRDNAKSRRDAQRVHCNRVRVILLDPTYCWTDGDSQRSQVL